MEFGSVSIANNGNTILGTGSIKNISSIINELKLNNPLICTDQGILKIGLLKKILEEFPDNSNFTVFSETPENPTELAVKKATSIYKKQNCDGIICFGGGSSIDLGKAVALCCTHNQPLEYYITQNNGSSKIGPVVPVIAIPNTAGTGSEVARACVLILENGQKRIIASPHLIPKISILDPDLTLTLPPHLTAATGMDAVTHCIEAILSPVINPSAEAIGLNGLERALGRNALVNSFNDGSDIDARQDMLIVSTQGAMAFSKGLGAVHAMSHACGKNPQIPLHHGTLNAVLLPTVLEYNKEYTGSKYSRISKVIGIKDELSLSEYFLNLNNKLGLPPNLSSMGINVSMIEDLSTHAVTDMTSMTNPVQMTKTAYCELFKKALKK